jgi:peroxiredoxin
MLLGLLLLTCAGDKQPVASPVERRSEAISFAFGTTDGGEFSSRGTRGRATLVLFVTTYDLPSQLQARRLDDLLRRFRPRANAGAVVLEAPKYAVFADAFRSTLSLSYPVAIADDDTRERHGPFGRVDRVPTLVILDRDGREVWRKSGVVSTKEIETELTRASDRASFLP